VFQTIIDVKAKSGRDIYMKTLLSLWATIFVSLAYAANLSAEVLNKDVIEVRDTFNKKGATSCASAMADTINFLANGRSFTFNALWGTTDANNKPMTLDYVIPGANDENSSSGSIILIPIKDKCIGAYVHSYVAPSHNCKIYMQKTGFDDKNMYHTSTYDNGEGGTAYISALNSVSNINFIFNDVGGGCSLTIREMLTLNANK
jgi:hypothetical protein